MRLRTLPLAVALAATLPACVVTVPLRTATVSESTLHRRPGRQATVVRLDSLGQRMMPERVRYFRFDGETASWLDPTARPMTASRRQIHTVDVVERTRWRPFRAGVTGFFVGGLGTIGVGALQNGDGCKSDGIGCGSVLMFYGFIVSPVVALATGLSSALLFPDLRKPVRYQITPVGTR